jgi:uncharacterized protein YidB (DUF937 family)
MGLLDDILGKALPDGKISKPLIIALGALILSGALSGKKSDSGQPAQIPPPAGNAGGGLGNLGGALAGGGLLGGLGGLIDAFTRGGQKGAIDSWIGNGPNQNVSAGDLGNVLGPDILKHLQEQTGLGQGDILSQLKDILPNLINGMTPNGRMPTEDEVQEDYHGARRGPGGVLDDLSRMSESLEPGRS